MRAAAADIQAAAEGFADFVAGVAEQHAAAAADGAEQPAQAAEQAQGRDGGGGSGGSSGNDGSGSSSGGIEGSGSGTARLGDALVAAVRGMEAMDWMVPPMLQPR